MATVITRNARKVRSCGPVDVGYVNISYPMMLTRKHITLQIGDEIIRIDWNEAPNVVKQMTKYLEQYAGET